MRERAPTWQGDGGGGVLHAAQLQRERVPPRVVDFVRVLPAYQPRLIQTPAHPLRSNHVIGGNSSLGRRRRRRRRMRRALRSELTRPSIHSELARVPL